MQLLISILEVFVVLVYDLFSRLWVWWPAYVRTSGPRFVVSRAIGGTNFYFHFISFTYLTSALYFKIFCIFVLRVTFWVCTKTRFLHKFCRMARFSLISSCVSRFLRNVKKITLYWEIVVHHFHRWYIHWHSEMLANTKFEMLILILF